MDVKEFFRKRPADDVAMAVDFVMVSLLLLFVGIWAWRTYMTTAPYVDPDKYPIRGIDVSAHNGMINFESVADEGYEFVFLKATEGSSFRDTNLRLNYEKATKAGLLVGVYHYFRFDDDGVAQAQNLLHSIGDRELDLGIAVDVETEGNATGVPPDSIKIRLRDMTDYLNLRGYRVLFYSNRDGYYDLLLPEMEGMPLWICSFQSNPIEAEWTFWQYYHRGRVLGINGDVDLNAFSGSRADFRGFVLDSRRVAGE